MQFKYSAFFMAMVTALFSQSVFAVYHQGISVVTDEGKPVQSATVSLSIPGQDTITVQDNGKGDDDDRVGFFKLAVADSAAGKQGTLKITSGGKTTTQTISIGKAVTVSVGGGAASTATTASTTSRMGGGEYTIDVSRTDGNADTSLTSPFFNGDGDHLDLTQVSFGLDYRLPLTGQPNMFWGAQGRVFIGNSDEGLNRDIHPTPGQDTFISYQEHVAAMLYAGMILASMNEYNLALILGARATQAKISGSSDESGGGGIDNNFSDVERSIQPSVILEMTAPRCDLISARWRAGIALDRNNDHSVNGVSTLGNDYHFSMDSEWQVRTFFGVVY